MSLDVGDALRGAYDRCITGAGIQLFAIAIVIQFVSTVSTESQMGFVSDVLGGGQGPGPLGFVPAGVAGLLGLLATIASMWFAVVAIRTFAADATDGVPSGFYTEDVVWPTVNVLVGSIVFGILVGIGFVLIVLPGVFLLVSLVFFVTFVALDDRNFFEALSASWDLTSGNRLDVFVVLVGLLFVGIVVGIAGGIVGIALGVVAPVLNSLVGVVVNAALTTYGLAVVTVAFRTLREGEAEGTEAVAPDEGVHEEWGAVGEPESDSTTGADSTVGEPDERGTGE